MVLKDADELPACCTPIPPNSLSAGGMKPIVAWFLFFQLVLGPTPLMSIGMKEAIKNFRNLNVDYPRVKFHRDFQDYCNGIMTHVRGTKKSPSCPKIHYVIHVPWNMVRTFCNKSDSFCENYSQYCTLTPDTVPLTICSLSKKQPPTSCRYNSTITNQRVYLLCSKKEDAEPMGIIGIF
ncbi:probable inactive ribonuclease-like protein 13 [Sorex fumeus]|uniref:probable inactive ribonuclease-like protein 13 n=1 Tax=Sorex fumeus TaxID=62283 RepID=UPI0024AE813E|nr:probable inactive ribonuclease-like protein 13 [Sorex fumeus]